MNLTLPWTTRRSTPINGLAGPIEDIRKSLSREVDHIAHLAAQVGRDIGSEATKAREETGAQAAVVAREVPQRASGLAQQIIRGVTQLGRDLRSDGERTARDLGKDIKSLSRDIRQVRVTTEPPRSRVDIMPGIALLAGFGSGLALMYFFDPNEGRRRRALFGDQVTKWTRIGRRAAIGKAEDLRNRTIGLAHDARKAVDGITSAADEETEQVRSVSSSRTASGNGDRDRAPWDAQPSEQPATTGVS